jgi:hypothetical protein
MSIENQTTAVADDQLQTVVDGPRCWTCGVALAPSRTRPRETCSLACQRRRQVVRRRIARRRAWMAEWQRFAAVGRVNRGEAAEQIAILTTEVERLQIPLWRTATADQTDSQRSE